MTTQTTSVESKLPLDLEHQPQLVSKQYAKDSMMFSDTSHRFKVPYFVPCPSDGLVQRYKILKNYVKAAIYSIRKHGAFCGSDAYLSIWSLLQMAQKKTAFKSFSDV